MNTYVAIIGGKAVLTFRAVDDDQAHAMIDDQEGSMRSDLKVLVDVDGKPLWDGKSAIQVREATAAEHAEWKQSRDQAISDGEIDLDARNDPDEWNVYLMGAPEEQSSAQELAFDRRMQPFQRLVTCPTTSSFGTSKPYLIFQVTLLPMVSLENRTKKSRESLGNKFPKHTTLRSTAWHRGKPLCVISKNRASQVTC